jgi:hypothetical protein
MSSMLTLAGNAAPTGFYDFPIEQSLRFNDNDNAYLSRTPASAGNQKTWTFSCWIKRGNIKQANILTAYTSSSNTTNITFDYGNGSNLQWYDYISGYRIQLTCSQVFRDVAGWYHLVFALDTTQATASDRAKIWVNGERVTAFVEETYPSQNADLKMNTAIEHRIGDTAQFAREFDGYMAEVNFIDGSAYTADSFGELKSGIWTPKDTADLTFGTNGFRLQFGDTTEANGFNAVTYTGNQTNGHAISGVGFSSSPDLVWIKERSSTSSHLLVDSVRGASKGLASDATSLEENLTAGEFSSFDSDGFTVDSNNRTNQSGQTYVAWCWDAGSGSAASNTDGDITSTVKANTDYGFSIVSYTGNGSAGATVGHSLGVQPDMIIVKNRDTARVWPVYHSYNTSEPETEWLRLNDTNATADESAIWNDTEPTSSVVTLGSSVGVNESGDNFIAYCFAEKTAYSKFGSYSGTGGAGNSITLGFKPAFLLIKETGNANSWELFDNTRNTSSPFDKRLFPNDSAAEATTTSLSYSDTGFETLNGNTGINRSGGTYIYMAFADTRDAAFWKDTSGQGNNWHPNNLVFSDVVPDSPTNNFNTFSSVITSNSGSLSEGNLKSSSVSGGSSNYGKMSSYNVQSGKWYFEFRITGGTANDIYAGAFYARTDNSIRFGKDMAAVYNGKIYADGVAVQTGLANPTINDVFGFAVDVDNSTCQVYRNGSTYGTLVDFSSSSYISNGFMGMGHYHGSSSTNSTAVVNYGQDSTFAGATAAGGNADENGLGDFAHPVPSGFLSLCSSNLPSGAINTLADETPEDYFNTVLYTGTGASNSVTVGFQPDFLWLKQRNAVDNHVLFDVVRGDPSNELYANLTNAEAASTGALISYDSDGFTLGASGDLGRYNENGSTYAAWNWKAGGTGVSNTDGSITSTVSVGATSQQNWFSISQYTGTGSSMTWGHGLGVKPDLFIVKKTNSADEWIVYPLGATGNLTQFLKLHSTSGYTSDSVLETANSSVLGFGSSGARNGSGDDYICYSFANAEGLCKAGSYVGNGSSTDGTFVYTGFRPSFVMWKRTDTTSDWFMMDVKRDIDNPTDHKLEANTSGAEVVNTAYHTDYLSNGFKLRNSNGQLNASGGNYIYLAIAEQPFKFANAR